MYNIFNVFIQINDSKDLVFFNDVDYVEKNNNINKNDINSFLLKNNNLNIYYISDKKEYDKYTWISNNFESDICILKTSNLKNFNKYKFKNVYLIVDDEKMFIESMVYLYNNTFGFIDFKLKNNFDKNILTPQFEILSDFIIKNILKNNFTQIKQLTSFFTPDKFDTFGENSIFISPELNVYRHPILYWTGCKSFSTLKDFYFSEQFVHASKPHIVCHNCETFYCDRNIYFNFKETTEYKVPAFTECNKTTFISRFQKYIFNNIQDKIILNDNEILDKINQDFNPSREYSKLSRNICITNKIKGFDQNYINIAKEYKNWKYKLEK